jgi:antitoxin component of RelBE/YafQ-DinJ toxin-antitoxin module
MARTVQARLDAPSEAALAVLRSEGLTDSEAIRLALSESAGRRRRRSALRAEAEAAAADPEDRAATARVLTDMEAVAAPWPEP